MTKLTILLVLLLSIMAALGEMDLFINDINRLNAVNSKLSALLQAIKQESNHESLIFLNLQKTQSWQVNNLELVLQYSQLPSLHLNEQHLNDFVYKENFPQELLIFVHVTSAQDFFEAVDSKFFKGLNRKRFLLLLDDEEIYNIAAEFCLESFQQEIFNIMLTNTALILDNKTYACHRHAPTGTFFKTKWLNVTNKFYEQQFLNMHGHTIQAQADQIAPHSMIYKDKNGKPKLLGYVGKLVSAFAERYNATLELKNLDVMQIKEMVDSVKNGTLDIGITTLNHMWTDLNSASYPYETARFCLMIPLPAHVATKKIFFKIVGNGTLVAWFVLIPVYGWLLNYISSSNSAQKFNCKTCHINKSLRCILAQAFPMRPEKSLFAFLIFFHLCYASLLSKTVYESFLHSWLIEHPMEPLVDDPKTMELSQIRIALVNYKPILALAQPFVEAHPNLYKIIETTEKYTGLLEELDTRFAYPILSAFWHVIVEQQKYFQRRIFYRSTTFCLMNFTFMQLPVRPRLPYLELFDEFILKVHAFGFYRLWISENFYDLLKLQKIDFKDLSKSINFGTSLRLEDFSWLLYIYVSLMALSIFVFFMEILINLFWKKGFKTIQLFID